MPKPIPVRCSRCGHCFKTRKTVNEARCGHCQSRQVEQITEDEFKELSAIEKELVAEDDALSSSDDAFSTPTGALEWGPSPEPVPDNLGPSPPQPSIPTVAQVVPPEIGEISKVLGQVGKSLSLFDRRLALIEKKLGADNGSQSAPQGQPSADMGGGAGFSTREALSDMMAAVMMKSLAASLQPPPVPAPAPSNNGEIAMLRQELRDLATKVEGNRSIQPTEVLALQSQVQRLEDAKWQASLEKMNESMRYIAASNRGPSDLQMFLQGLQFAQEQRGPSDQYGYMAKSLDVVERGLTKIADGVGDRIDTALEIQAMKENRPVPSAVAQRRAERLAQARQDHPEYFDDSMEGTLEAAEKWGVASQEVPNEKMVAPGVVEVPMESMEAATFKNLMPGTSVSPLSAAEADELYGE